MYICAWSQKCYTGVFVYQNHFKTLNWYWAGRAADRAAEKLLIDGVDW